MLPACSAIISRKQSWSAALHENFRIVCRLSYGCFLLSRSFLPWNRSKGQQCLDVYDSLWLWQLHTVFSAYAYTSLEIWLRQWVEDLSYFGARPETFASLADIVLVVDGNSYPAHSQFVASRSRLMYRLTEDCPGFTRHQPLVISSALKAYKHADAHTFLKHVYTDCKVTSNTEALQLLTIADQFDLPPLMEKAIVFLEAEGNGSFLQADCGPKESCIGCTLLTALAL